MTCPTPPPGWDQLGLGEPNPAWLAAATRLPPARLDLPTGRELVALLDEFGFAAEDAAALPDLLAAVAADPTLAWIAARFVTAIRQDAGRFDLLSPYADPSRAWPTLPLSAHPAGRCVYLAGLLIARDAVRAEHAGRGVPEEYSRRTLRDLGRHAAIHRRTFGQPGIDTQWWFMLSWSGALIDLGRLQAEYLDATSVGLHIPESGPLLAAEIDASLQRLAAGWPGWFGVAPARAECESWMLDPVLADVLPASSNIVRFQRRFTLVGDGYVDDDNVVNFVFRRHGIAVPDGLGALPRDTSLQRAIIDRLAAGGHWSIRKGWLAL